MPVKILDNSTVILCATVVIIPYATALQNEMITRVAT